MKILSTADWHLDLLTHGTIDDNGVNSRVKEARNLIADIFKIAKDESPDCVIVAGDVFHTSHPSIESQIHFFNFIISMEMLGIPTFIIVGNHDFNPRFGKLDALSLYASIIKSLPVMQHIKVIYEDKVVNSVPGASIHFHPFGVPYIPFTPSDGRKSILVCHAHLDGAKVGSEPFEIKTPDVFKYQGLPYDIIIAGHFHKPQILCDKPLVFYPGSIMQIDFNERNERKCVFMIDTEGKSRWIPLNHTFLYQIDVKYPEQITDGQYVHCDGKIVKVVIKVPRDKIDYYDEVDIKNKIINHGAKNLVKIVFDVEDQRILRSPDVKFDLDIRSNFDNYIVAMDITGKDMIISLGHKIIDKIVKK